jgi:hypothetical protein
MITRSRKIIFQGNKARPVRRADNLIAVKWLLCCTCCVLWIGKFPVLDTEITSQTAAENPGSPLTLEVGQIRNAQIERDMSQREN